MSFASSARRFALASVLVLGATPALAAGDAAQGLQDLKALNLIVLGNMSGGQDVEGKAYIGGNLTNGGTFGNGRTNQGFAPSDFYTLMVGGNATGSIHINDGNNGATVHGVSPSGAVIGGDAGSVDLNGPAPTLLVGGSIAHTNGAAGATVLAGGALGDANPTGANVHGNQAAGFSPLITALPARTATITADLTALSHTLAVLAPALSTTSGDANNFSINAVDGGDGYAVFDITNGQAFFSQFHNLILNLPTLAGGGHLTTIINVAGSSAYDFQFNDNNSIDNPYVIWNFIGATSINFERQFNGSVLALGATITNSSDIEGSIVATNFNQRGEGHLGTFDGMDGFLPHGVPEPAGWALMLTGFFGLGASLRRQRRPLAA